MRKLFLFDCDQTLWLSGNEDYISSLCSPLTAISKTVIQRSKDGNKFRLREGILGALQLISKENGLIGVVSDNKIDMVVSGLKLFDIYKFIDKEAINVRLWDGFCPKHKMVKEILEKKEFSDVDPGNVYWFDDKDYSKEADSIGVNFVQVNEKSDLTQMVKDIID